MKRPLLHRLFSGFMALLVLTTSVGLTVQSHTCRSSGRSTAAIIFSAPQHKCPPASSAAALAASHQLPGKAELKKSCCEFGAHFHKLEAASHTSDQAKLLPPVLTAWSPASDWGLFQPGRLVTQGATWHASDSSPPLRAGRMLLVFVGTWQV
ncbi:HYC_CC_PP family protein [Hymenobacter lucidus]|uniref:Secreted protein n=1 Tax=Hymenobacter lucidus TaxID=2880930 RepID=A0ABS8APN6_9BACT|nr:hypothetical protein [Hymenobacter lucidus]MCB2408180.1 hypothetical protein [Hymenobacter lucidus]